MDRRKMPADSNLPDCSEDAILEGLALSHMDRHSATGELADLEEATSLYRRVLDLRPEGHPDRVSTLNNLGCALRLSCRRLKSTPKLMESIALHEEAHVNSPPGHPLRDVSLYNLALVLRTRYELLGDRDHLSRAISLHRMALQLRPTGHVARGRSLSSLGSCLFIAHETHGDASALGESIVLYRESLQLHEPGSVARITPLTSLAIVLRMSCQQQYDHSVLLEAIAMHHEALALCSSSDPNKEHSLSGLGAAYRMLYTHEGNPDSLAESIRLQRECVLLRPPGHPFRFATVQNLASSLHVRFRTHEDVEALEEVVALHREGLALSPTGNHFRILALHNLGGALLTMSRRTRDRAMLHEAISLHREAAALKPQDPVIRFSVSNELAKTLKVAFEETMGLDCLDEAVALHRTTLQLCPSGHPGRRDVLNDLASALRCAFEQRGDAAILCEALDLHREALVLQQPGDPDRGRAVFGIAVCLLLSSSPHVDFLGAISHILDGLLDDLAPTAERVRNGVGALRVLERSYASMRDLSSESANDDLEVRILESYAAVVRLLPRVANLGFSHAARLEALSGCEELSRTAAVRALLLGRDGQAVELLEEGRGIFWCESLRVNATVMGSLPAEDRQDFQHSLHALEDAMPSEPVSSLSHRVAEIERRRQVVCRLETVLARIRSRPGWGRFLMPQSFDNLLQSLPNGYIAIIIPSTIGCYALVLNKTKGLRKSIALKAPPGGFSSAPVRNSLPRGTVPVLCESEEHRGMRLRDATISTLEGTLVTLWNAVLKPVIEVLRVTKATGRDRPRLWLCGTGEFSSILPLHAAGVYSGPDGECASDYFVVSCTPTLSALTRAHRGSRPIGLSDVRALVGAASPGSGPLPPLLYAQDEVRIVKEQLQAASMHVLDSTAEHLRIEDVRSGLKDHQANILHLACHGVQAAQPLESCFVLADGKLTIGDLMKLDLPQATFAFLSACQTAKSNHNHADQTVHLAASMLFCGFRSVVGTLWSMSDADGPQVARWFYESLLGDEQVHSDDIAYALDEAVRRLRADGVPAARWAPFVHIGG